MLSLSFSFSLPSVDLRRLPQEDMSENGDSNDETTASFAIDSRLEDICDLIETLQAKSLQEIGYTRAANLLQDLRNFQGCDALQTALQTVECELRLQRAAEEESIQRVQDIIFRFAIFSEFDDDTQELELLSIDELRENSFTFKPVSADDVLEEGKRLASDEINQRVSALILYRISHEVYEQEQHDAEESVDWIKNLIHSIFLVAYNLAALDDTSRIIALEYGAIYAEELLAYLRRINDSTAAIKALAEADCLYFTGNIYFRTQEYETAIPLLQEATRIFTEVFPGTACNNEHYCISLWTIGNCKYRLKKFDEAEECFQKAAEEILNSDHSTGIEERWLKIIIRDLGKACFKREKYE